MNRLSDEIKLELMKYFRFERNYNLICTEGIHNSDVNAFNGDSLVEIEVKISKSDFKKEFKPCENKFINRSTYWKQYKHNNYAKPSEHPSYTIPNRFYFCVPAKLEEWAFEYLKDKNPKYGLLVYDLERWTGNAYIITKKPAKNLHNEKPEPGILLQLGRRAANELITAKEKFIEQRAELEALKKGILTTEQE